MTRDPDPIDLARLLAQLSGDLVLVLDTQGRILELAAGADTALPPGTADWAGRSWADTVAPDSQPKAARMLRELATTGRARRRELNHPGGSGGGLAYAYHAVRLESGASLAMGRDLSAQSALQQRLLQAQREAYSSSPEASLMPKRRSLT